MNNDKIVEFVQLFKNNSYAQLTTDFTLNERIWLLEFVVNSSNSLSTQGERELFNMFNNGTIDEEEFFNSILSENEAKIIVAKTNFWEIKEICINKMKDQDKINYVNSLPKEERLDILEQFNYLFSKNVQEEVINELSDDIKINYLINNNSVKPFNKKIILSLSLENQIKFLKLCSEKYDATRVANVEQTIISNMTIQHKYELLTNVKQELSLDTETQIISSVLENIKYFAQEQQIKIIDIITSKRTEFLQELVSNIDSFTIESQYYFIKEYKESVYQQKKKEIIERIINHNIDIISLEEQKKYISDQNSKELSQESRGKVINNIIKKSSNKELFSTFINKSSGSYVESSTDTKKTIISKLSLEYIFSIYMNDNIQNDEVLKEITIKNINNKLKTFENKKKLIIINNDRIPLDRINECLELFGNDIVDFLYSNQNIRNILTLQEEYYNKIINIFKASQLDADKINTVYNTLIQEELRTNKKDIIEFNDNLKKAIKNDNKEFIEFAIKELTANLDINNLLKNELFVNHIKTKGYTVESLLSSRETLAKLVSQIINDAYNNKTTEQFEFVDIISKNYIAEMREKYTKSRREVLNYPTKVEKNKIISKVIKELQHEELIRLINSIPKDSLNETQVELIKNKELLLECIEFKKNPVKNTKLGKNLKTFNTIMEIMYFNDMLNVYATDNEKEKYIPKELGRMSIEILADLDYNKLINNLIFTPNYEQIISIISKYGFLAWNDLFGDLTEQLSEVCLIQFNYNEEIPKYFLEYFDIILNEKLKNNNQIQMLDYIKAAAAFVPGGELDKILFGERNYDLLRNNPGVHKGTMTAQERIQKAKGFVSKMYQREYIAIPPINDVISNNNNTKSLRVIVGDTTGMDNLTYGEATDACVRLGSFGESMYEFALTNENGFHIRFEDPETKKFVSRVTGFRNGNTLFLNSLRESVSDRYNNSDLCEIATKLGNKIVESTRGSKYPIENILIGNQLAMQKSSVARVSIEDTNDKDYVPKISGTNHDISTDLRSLKNVIVLATSAKNKPYEDVKPGLEQHEKYNISRKKTTIHSDKKDASDRITQLNLLNQLLINDSLGAVSPLEPEEIAFAITGEDWYIYVEHNGEIKSKVLDNLPETKKEMAHKELISALDIVKKRLNVNQMPIKEDTYGMEESNHGRGR